MASTNRSRNTEFSRVADDDPFAELTRIVERGPLGPAGDRSHAANDPLGLDMENELLGNLARFERPAQASVAPSSQDVEEIDPLSDVDGVDLAMDAEFEAAFEDDWNVEDAQPEPAFGEPIAPEEAFGDGHAPHFFDRVAAELRGKDFVGAGIVENDQARTLSDEEITAFAAEWEDSHVAEADDPASDAQDIPPEHLFVRHEDNKEQPQDSAREDEHLAQEAVPEALFAEEAGEVDAVDMPDLLLSSDLEAVFADEQIDADDEAEASAALDDIPFDYDKAAAGRHDYLGHVFDDVSPDMGDEADVASGDTAETSLQENGDAIATLSAAENDASGLRASMSSAFTTVPFWGKVARPEPTEARYEENHEDAGQEVPSFPRAFDAESMVSAEETAVSGDPERPQVETIDIEDRAAAVVDDLDIPDPELPPEPATDSEFDELAAELAGAFGEMTDEALAEPAATGVGQQYATAAFAGEEQHRSETADADPVSPFAEEQYQFDTAVAATSFDVPFEPEGREEFASWSGGMEDEAAVAPAPVRRALPFARFGKRGMLGAAGLAALVVIGGASVFALSSGSGGLGGPALVQASDEPFKVKPKDTGGKTVSADSNQVYQRASGNVGDVPEQKALLTTTEEPLDLSKAAAPRIVDASAVRSAASGEGAATDDTWSKSQARLDPADDAQASDVPPALTVQAHRVETFVVKPDGTLVPREPAQDETTEVASTAPDDQAANAAVVDSDADAASVADDGDASASAAAPAPKPAKEEAEPAKPVAVASTAAEKPALAPAATQAASDWSVQVSSQPTPAAAQGSYRRIAERYGDLLAGRGVNIVKADIAGKGTYYRVRIPSASKDEAIDLCTKLKGAGGNCFVSK